MSSPRIVSLEARDVRYPSGTLENRLREWVDQAASIADALALEEA